MLTDDHEVPTGPSAEVHERVKAIEFELGLSDQLSLGDGHAVEFPISDRDDQAAGTRFDRTLAGAVRSKRRRGEFGDQAVEMRPGGDQEIHFPKSTRAGEELDD